MRERSNSEKAHPSNVTRFEQRSRPSAGIAAALAIVLALAAVAVDSGAAPLPVAATETQRPNGPVPDPRQEPPTPPPPRGELAVPPLTPKQKQALLKDNFKKMQSEADELSELAQSLQKDLAKSNENILSLEVVEKAERIEKLAKKIKSGATAY